METTIDHAVLQALAASSLATLLLVHSGNHLRMAARPEMFGVGGCITPEWDGTSDAGTIFVRDAAGIGIFSESRTTLPLTMRIAQHGVDWADLAQILKQKTGLAIEVLAKAAGVSKVSYHKWLNGAGLSEESRQRLTELLDTFGVLRQAQPDLRRFLDQSTAAGTPLELLAARKDALAIGIALKGTGSVQRRATYPVDGTLKRVRSLGWATQIDRNRLEDLSPGARPDVATPTTDEGEPRSVGYALFQG
jgi:transcriptional regulator with XRE-family HTH domain